MSIISNRVLIQYLLGLDVHWQIEKFTRLVYLILVFVIKTCRGVLHYPVKHLINSIDSMVFQNEKAPFLAGLEDFLGDLVKFRRKVFQGDDRKLHSGKKITCNLML